MRTQGHKPLGGSEIHSTLIDDFLRNPIQIENMQ